MKAFFQQVINGLDLGSIYALIAIGYTLVYGVLRLINFAHGDILMVGAFLSFLAGSRLHWSFWPSLLLAVAGCALAGVLMERLAYRPLRNAPRITALITAIGISLVLEKGGQVVPWFGPNPLPYPHLVPDRSFTVGGASIRMTNIYVWVATTIILVSLWYLVTRTRLGRAMRAVQHDQAAAALMGINVNAIISFTFALGSALAAIAGVLYASENPQIDPAMGLMPGLKAFVAAVLGGIGSVPGAVLGGLLLGVIETFVASTKYGNVYRDGIAFVILIAVLLWRPTGLLGTGSVEKV